MKALTFVSMILLAISGATAQPVNCSVRLTPLPQRVFRLKTRPRRILESACAANRRISICLSVTRGSNFVRPSFFWLSNAARGARNLKKSGSASAGDALI